MASRRGRNNTVNETDSVDVSGVPMEIEENVMTEETEIPFEETLSDEILSDETPIEETVSEDEDTPKERIPSVLEQNPILVDFCNRYLTVLDEISGYNAEVLAEKSSEWPLTRVLEKAKELANPTDANIAPNAEIREAHEAWQNLITEVNKAKRNVLELTAKELGITLTNTIERDSEAEKPLKEARGLAIEIGKQLDMIAGMTTDTAAKEAVKDFLNSNPLPVIGRKQVSTIGSGDGKTTPKYRVNVTVFDNDGNQRGETQQGFTKASLAIGRLYGHGDGVSAEELRKLWEAAGNSSENTAQETVEFVKGDYRIVITKR